MSESELTEITVVGDDLAVHRGRTELRDGAVEEADSEDSAGYRLGMGPELDRATPDEPTDGEVPKPASDDD